jgi:hypothetical protein
MAGARSFLLIKLLTIEEVMCSEANDGCHEVTKSKILEDLTVEGGLMSCIPQRNRCVVNTRFYKPS